uniref:Ig-like domain-containing protein n=1 Tax=Parascaris equorum TaxID=6256 RepID=A0A914S8X2_PAREQ
MLYREQDTSFHAISLADDATSVESSCALTVKLPKLVITRGLEDQTANVGEKVHLGVEVNAKPRIVKWYKNGKEITSSDKENAIRVNDTNYQLEIPDVTLDDTSNYKSSADSSCALTIRLPAERPTFKKGIEDQTIPVGKPLEIIIEIIVEPELVFLTPLKDIDVVEGEEAVFFVETNAHPRTVKWYKNGTEVKSVPGRIDIKGNMSKFRLVIAKTEKNDAATYKTSFSISNVSVCSEARFQVVLSNSAGEVESSARLSIKIAKGQPKILKGLDDQVIAKGTTLILEIKVEGEPTEVRWLKDGAAIPKTANAKIEKIDDQT